LETPGGKLLWRIEKVSSRKTTPVSRSLLDGSEELAKPVRFVHQNVRSAGCSLVGMPGFLPVKDRRTCREDDESRTSTEFRKQLTMTKEVVGVSEVSITFG
jgi:hypothetical protein